MKDKLFLKDVEVKVDEKYVMIKSKHALKVLSSAVLNGGFFEANFIVNFHMDEDDFIDCDKPEGYLRRRCVSLGIDPSKAVGMVTRADTSKAGISLMEDEGISVLSVVTAGLSNPATAGDTVPKELRKVTGTINTIVVIDGNLTDTGFVNALKTVVEAKSMVMREVDVRSRFGEEVASGTTTDSVALACTCKGRKTNYAGTATLVGELIGKSVRKSMRESIIKGSIYKPGRPIIKRLEERGIHVEDMVKCCMEMVIPGGKLTRERAENMVKKIMLEFLRDPNVSSLMLAAIKLEEEGNYGNIPGLPRDEFKKDPAWLVADEIIGMAIANYIAGTRGIFEYIRFDTRKPGILSKLGPFLDDAIGGLLAGISSEMYSRSLRDEDDRDS